MYFKNGPPGKVFEMTNCVIRRGGQSPNDRVRSGRESRRDRGRGNRAGWTRVNRPVRRLETPK